MDVGYAKIKRLKNPFEKASIFSKFTFWWLKDIFKLGLTNEIREENIYDTLEKHDSDKISAKFTKLWNEEINSKCRTPSLLRVIFKIYGVSIIGTGFLYSIVNWLARLYQPLFLGGLLTYFSSGNVSITKDDAYVYGIYMIICSLVPVLVFHPFIFHIVQIGMKIRLASCSLLYKKILRIKKSAIADGMSGKVITLMSTDATKFDTAIVFIQDLYRGPIEFLLLGYFIYREIGIAGLYGLAVMLIVVPLQIYMGKKSGKYRNRTAKKTEIRVKLMNEIIHGIQVLKMYAWEKPFGTIIDKIRKEEIKYIKGTLRIRALLVIFTIISRYSIFVSLMMYIYFENDLTAQKVFIITSYFNSLYNSMLHMWPVALISVYEALISIKRIQNFLLLSECKPEIKVNDKKTFLFNGEVKHNNGDILNEENPMVIKVSNGIKKPTSRRIVNFNAEKIGIIFKNASAYYTQKLQEVFIGVKSLDLNVESAKLCTVIGPVGSGKTTMLQMILGELEIDDGVLLVNGNLSYASQEPWLFEGTVRRNILFTEEYDAARYEEVVRICALDKDFQIFPHGDATIIGEQGISLSGGQKARVNLARAVYKKADIYLLDDPLSAVDSQVGKYIFDNCIKNFLMDKVCILVTHQLQHLKDTEHIVLMNLGHIEAQGSYEALKHSKSTFVLSNISDVTDIDVDVNLGCDLNSPSKPIFYKTEQNTEKSKENQSTGNVGFSVYKKYFAALNSNIILVFVALIFVVTQVTVSGVDILVKNWVNQEDKFTALSLSSNKNQTDELHAEMSNYRHFHTILYSSIMAALLFLSLFRSFSFFNICLRISRNLHNKLVSGLMNGTMHFFNQNPSGRIINRFSQDIGLLDTKLAIALVECIAFFLEFTAIITIVSIVNYYLLIPTILLAILFYLLRYVYVRTSRNIKRIEAMSRSPIYSHANATLQGLSTIRALKAQKILTEEFHQHQNLNISASFMYLGTTRAFGLWLEIVCVIYMAVVTLSFLVFENEILSGNVGIAITQVFNLGYMSQWGMRQTAELENQMISVERVLEYTNIKAEETEKDIEGKIQMQDDWPKNGIIYFKNLSLKYSEEEDFILKDLNITIESNEKIGIVGRTGAGKSSIIQALFRLANNHGLIKIDRIDIETIKLTDLRNKISIIPQDPILFTGTLRQNLDPFNKKNDEDIWNALEQVELKNSVTILPEGILARVLDGGSNFSMGQRQLICLARAILRENKILILDEATANVDPETDMLIQKTIRTKFKNCTVLTIAHRLHTVMDSDRVLVMDGGRCVEFDHPYELLQNSNSIFRMFVEQTGSSMTSHLIKIAKDNFYNKKL